MAIEIQASDNQGNTWSVIKTVEDGFFPAIIKDIIGRMWLFYYKTMELAGVEKGYIFEIHSDDEGTTWSEEISLALEQGTPPSEVEPAESKIGVTMDVCGRMYITFWGNGVKKFAYSDDIYAAVPTWTVKTR